MSFDRHALPCISTCFEFAQVDPSPKSILCTLHQFITLSPSSGCVKTHQSQGETGGPRWRRKGLMTARVRCLHRSTPSADEKPDGCDSEHQAKYRKKQPTCLVNAGVHCSLLSRGRHRNDACRSSVPKNSPISGFCYSGPGPKHCLASPWSASGQTEVLSWAL